VFDAHGAAVAAIDVVVRTSRADVKRLAPAVRCAAIGASRELCRRALLEEGAHV
jgi:hypothetical protein